MHHWTNAISIDGDGYAGTTIIVEQKAKGEEDSRQQQA